MYKNDVKMKKEVLNFLSELEGYHQILKEIHWSTKNKAEHLLTDEIDSAVLEYEDSIAENTMGILNTRFGVGDLKSLLPNAKSLDGVLKEMNDDLTSLRDKLDGDNNYVGLINILDDFASDINKWNYLRTFS